VALEDLHVKGMLANAHLARSIADVGFQEIRRQLQYKARRYGTVIVLADRWYPSSSIPVSCTDCNDRRRKPFICKTIGSVVAAIGTMAASFTFYRRTAPSRRAS
jgi:putative transposase